MPKEQKPELLGWVGIMRVAVLTRKRYQKARDMMLAGTFGPSNYDGKTLLVEEKKVLAYVDKEKKNAAG